MEDSIIINTQHRSSSSRKKQKNLSLAINLVKACGEQKQSGNKL